MKLISKKTGRCLVLLFAVMAFPVLVFAYGYPIADPFVATVVGTPGPAKAELPDDVPLKRSSLQIFPDREVPEVFWYDEKLRYSYAFQKKAAPLVFIIAGTGASHDSSHNWNMARAFYGAGFHTVTLSSPTSANFIVAASKTSVPGHPVKDAEDLYRVMERIREKHASKIEVTDYYVTGYSLGGFNAAYVAWLDEQQQQFNFRKVLLINPPVRLYSSVSLLDRMLENIPGGIDNFSRYYDNLVKALSEAYKRSDSVQFNEDLMVKAFEVMQPKNEELAALIGVTFRLASAGLAFTSDVMTDYGYVQPSNMELTVNTDISEYSKVSTHLGFTDYFHTYYYPYYGKDDPSITRAEMIEMISLTQIEDYLRSAEKIEVMTNADDLILKQGEIDFFPRVFGERAKIYPVGGHLGNMDYVENVAHKVNVFKQ